MPDLKVSGRAVSKGIDSNGNIFVEVEYTNVDGSITVGSLHFDATKFSADAVRAGIKEHVERIIRKACLLKMNREAAKDFDITDIAYEASTAVILTAPEVVKDGKVLRAKKELTLDLNAE